MLSSRIFMILTGLLTAGYALFVFFDLSVLTDMIGLQTDSSVARLELLATYGGWQCSLGLLLAWCGWQSRYLQHGLILLCATMSGLLGARLIAATMLGVWSESYTLNAVIFEGVLLALGVGFLLLERRANTA